MLTITRTLAGCFLALLFCVRAFAQTDQPIDAPPEPKQPPAQASIIITATASSQRVRSVALGEVNQTRLQVFSTDGSPIFDSQFRLGNLVDWQLVDQHGQPLTDGSYLFLVTVKDFSGHLTQKYGTAVLEQEQVSLGQAARDELPQSLAVALEANRLSDTLSTVDRVGVAATARATTIPTDSTTIDTVTDGQRTKTKQATAGGENIVGTGTQNVIAKWTDNAGTVGNSTISEVNGQVGIGTMTPGGQLHIFGTAGQDVFAGMGPDLINGPALNFGYAGSSFGRGAGFFNVRPDASATAPNPSLRFATVNTERMIITNTGKVGIGTSSPQSLLDVAGNINTSSQYNIGGNRVLSVDGPNGITFAGLNAGKKNTGVYNTFFGDSAGQQNMSGYLNTYFGYAAGENGKSGTRNVAIGSLAGLNATGDNNVYIGDSVDGYSGSNNTFVGALSGGSNTGDHNTFIGASAGTVVNYDNISYSAAIGAGAFVNTSHTMVIGTDQEVVDIPGKLQLDTLGVAGSTQLCLNSSNRVGTCSSSSLRYKTAVQSFFGGLNIIRRLRPISFTWKQEGTRDIGFGAEDVEQVEPLFTFRNQRGEIEGVKYDRISVALVNAVKEQQQEIERQLNQLKAQQQEIASLKRLVCKGHARAGACRR